MLGDEAKLRRAFHPGALQVGHFGETYEFFPLEEFIAWLKGEETEAEGSPIIAELLSIEVTGTVAVAKLTDSRFGTDVTDHLVMVMDRRDAGGRGSSRPRPVTPMPGAACRRHRAEADGPVRARARQAAPESGHCAASSARRASASRAESMRARRRRLIS